MPGGRGGRRLRRTRVLAGDTSNFTVETSTSIENGLDLVGDIGTFDGRARDLRRLKDSFTAITRSDEVEGDASMLCCV